MDWSFSPLNVTKTTHAALCVVLLTTFSGCAMYRFGACSLYRPDIQTVHVPVIHSASFRRNLGERLTEAVVKEIETSSPYKVVGSADADSTLIVTIDGDAKRVLAENANDEPRSLETSFYVTMTWRDRRGNLITQTTVPLEETVVALAQPSNFIPESGQSLTTAQQKVIQGLATQIVSQMEAGW